MTGRSDVTSRAAPAHTRRRAQRSVQGMLYRALVPMTAVTVIVGGMAGASARPVAPEPVAAPEPAADSADWSVRPAREAARRLLPDHAHRIRFVAEQPGPDGADHYRIGAWGGLVEIGGTSPAVLLTGLNAYLGQVADANISWNGEQLDLPARLPLPDRETVSPAVVSHRFAGNDTDDGYTGAYRTWADWEREIDVLALHGINEVFVPVGAEAVYHDTFQEFGYSAEEMREWIPQPAHQPWWLLQNMCCFPSAMSEQLIERRAQLGRRIVNRLNELGMTPVLPGYFGTVPRDFAERNPAANVVPQGGWVGFDRPGWLDPTRDHFAQVAQAFYRNSAKRFGTSTMYKMDLLHEGGTAGSVDVAAASRAVESALQEARPGAIWAILGWQNNPRPETLAAIDRSKMLIVDGLSDRYDGLDREDSWRGTPYAFGSIWNFGGHTTMGANMSVWNERFTAWREKDGSALDGIAVVPEAADNNPVAFDFLTSLAWRDAPADMDAWFTSWAQRRYGGADDAAERAWRHLGATAYAMPAGTWSEAQDALFGAEPDLSATSAATWSPGSMRYDATEFAAALPALLDVAPALRDSSAYRYDLMDVTRQVLSNRSRQLLPLIEDAYDARDLSRFRELTGQWFESMALLEDVVATNEQTMLGPWLDDARSWGADDAEADRLEHDARTLLSVWGHRSGAEAGLNDYANREWAGLVSGYYEPRWRAYFDELEAALVKQRAPEPIDWYAFGARWASSQNEFAERPSGAVYEVATRVLEHLESVALPLAVSADRGAGVVSADEPVTVAVEVTNDNAVGAAADVRVEVDPPAGLAVRPVDDVAVAELAPGETFTAEFEVTVADAAAFDGVTATLDAVATYAIGGEDRTSSAPVRLLAGESPSDPFRTVSFNDSAFGQRGESFAILGGGADLWGGTNEFGSIYRTDVLRSGGSVSTTVVAQESTWPWARAGLVARDDLTSQGAGGYVNLAVTSGHGCVLSWDSDGNGSFDTFAQDASFEAPVRLRLSREGDRFVGECSTDGESWTRVGAAAVTAAEAVDVGLFMSAVNVVSGLRGLVEFDGFVVDE